MEPKDIFAERISVEEVEEGDQLAPKFDSEGLIPVVTTDYKTGELLMHAYMNQDSLAKTIEIGCGWMLWEVQVAMSAIDPASTEAFPSVKKRKGNRQSR